MSTILSLQNYRCFARLEWSLPTFGLLVGPNGSGKSTLLSTLDFVRSLYLRPTTTAINLSGGAWGFRNLSSAADEEVAISLTVDNTTWRAQFGLRGGQATGEIGETVSVGDRLVLNRKLYADSFVVEGETLRCDDGSALRKACDATEDTSLWRFAERVRAFRVYGGYAVNELRERGSRMDADLYLHRTGDNLFTVLRNWRDRRDLKPQYDAVVEGLRDAFPDLFEDLDFEVSAQSVSARVYLKHLREPVPVNWLPEGLLIGMLHLTAARGTRGVLAIDEMENALHPYAICSLANTFRKWAAAHECSIVLATHSPVLLDAFRRTPEDIHVMQRNHATLPVPLTELRDPEWLQHFSLGDLYAGLEFGAPAVSDPSEAA